ncbi:MAG: Fe-S cluster assembly protein SufD [Xanthomonadales bacterium]|nr:Fe-S cluster assembly protein SufD [Xanthomonadales bacterium]
MSALLESLVAGFDQLPRRDVLGLGASRREALDAAIADGLPTTRRERWKYTALRALEQRRFVLPHQRQIDESDLDAELPPAPRMVFVDGRFDALRSSLSALPDGVELLPLSAGLDGDSERKVNVLGRRWTEEDAGFWRLNAALAVEGALLRLEEGVRLPEPLHLVFVTTGSATDLAVHLRHRIELREGARATLVEHHIGQADERPLLNQVCHVHQKPRTLLEHVRIQRAASGASMVARTEAVLAREATYRLLSLELGAGLSRHDLAIDLQGQDAHAEVRGLVRCRDRQHVDTQLMLRHQLPQTTSDTQWRAIAGGRSRAVFHGGILIAEGADGSDAALETRNLLLTDSAEIDAQPVLEIHADEVKASHGATIGQLDERALFYLRSRGLPEAEARRLLVFAFCRSLLEGVSDEALQSELARVVKQSLFNDGEAVA